MLEEIFEYAVIDEEYISYIDVFCSDIAKKHLQGIRVDIENIGNIENNYDNYTSFWIRKMDDSNLRQRFDIHNNLIERTEIFGLNKNYFSDVILARGMKMVFDSIKDKFPDSEITYVYSGDSGEELQLNRNPSIALGFMKIFRQSIFEKIVKCYKKYY